MSESEFEDVDAKLQELNQQVSELSERCHYRTSLRVAAEARRLARVERKLLPYMTASFHVMNDSRNVLQPTTGRETAIELITLLESDDRARQFQSDVAEEEYERTRWWLTACSYDNLAVNTAESNGYNSDGMHQCITEGIQVCRRTGKLQCISCFREYATDVYIAADDLDMALHHARVGINNKDPGPHDRRHVGAKDSVRILMLRGQVEAAIEVLDLAWKLSDVYHSPYAGKLDTHNRAIELYYLAGCPERLQELPKVLSFAEGETYDGPDDAVLIEPPRDEYPSYFLDRDLAHSFIACCRGDYDAAAALLQPWDVQLREQKCLTKWFEVRLRLVAIARLTGKMQRALALAKPLQEAAVQSRDWFIQKRLERLMDESIPATPLALAGPVTVGPYADSPQAAAPATASPVPTERDQAPSEEDGASDEPETPLGETTQNLFVGLMESGGEPDKISAILNSMLEIPATSATHPLDAERLLHVARFIASDGERAGEVWTWSGMIARQFPQNANVLSMHAALGSHLRMIAEGSLDHDITGEALESLFRQSLDLDPSAGANFARAGTYYLEQENYGEAERCLARGFRLLRSSAQLALRLAEVYSRTDRPRDALAVLDMALREGCDDPDVAWEAAVTANHVEQYDAAVTYLDRFDELNPDQPWSHYYRASALLELGRADEALASLETESKLNPDATYHVEVLRASCLGELDRLTDFRAQLDRVLATPLYEVTYLTQQGLQRLLTRLLKTASECLEPDDPDLIRLETRLLESGLAPNELFAAYRDRATDDSGNGRQGTVHFYRCVLRQPLDEQWESFPGRLAGDEGWSAYIVTWGILARDEAEATRTALSWQHRCYPLPAELLDVEQDGADYTDKPGVVWQGFRDGVTDEGDDVDDMDNGDDADQEL